MLLAGSVASALTIEFDYTYDTNGFFDQPGSKEALRAVADFFEERIQDNLLEINQNTFGSGNSWTARFWHPGTGELQSVEGLIVPADTIIIYAGGRDIGGASGRGGPGGYSLSGTSQAWFDRVDARGQTGELDVPATDFGPWGGAVTFHTGKTWHFELDGRPATSASDFVSVALHELGHVLGIGTAESWDAQIDGDDLFQGVRCVESFGGPVPVDATWGHWQNDGACSWPLGYDPDNPLNILSLTYTSFGTAHGGNQIALMDPSSCTITSSTTLKVFTDLDLAALSDIGWEISQPVALEGPVVVPTQVSLSWPSTTGQTYTLQRRVDFDSDWVDLTLAESGDGQLVTYLDTSPPAGKAFYRLVSESAAAPEALALSAAFASEPLPLGEERVEVPRTVDGCGEH
jgi:hypothetical protein